MEHWLRGQVDLSHVLTKNDKPSFWHDWITRLPALVRVLKKCPFVFAAYVLLGAAEEFFAPFQYATYGIFFAEIILLWYLFYFLISDVASGANGIKPDFRRNLSGVAKVACVGFSLSISSALLAFLLIIPGLCWWTLNCLAIIVSVVENKPLIKCFERSCLLVRNDFWLAFKYAVFFPSILSIIWGITTHLYWCVTGLPSPGMPVSTVGMVFEILHGVGDGLISLSLIGPSVKLFEYFSAKGDMPASQLKS